MKKLLASLAAAAAMIVGTAGAAMAHTGTVTAQEDCYTWSVTVALDANVSADRTYDVTTTIPGTTGTSGSGPGPKVVAEYAGDAPASGTVTLTIDDGTEQEFTTSASIYPEEGCVQIVEIAPPVLVERTCDKPDRVTVVEIEHASASVSGSLTGPGHVEIDFTADEGYAFAEGAQTHFEFELRDAKDCTTPTPTPTPTHTPPPAPKPKPPGTAMTGPFAAGKAIAAGIFALVGGALLYIGRRRSVA